MCYFARIRGAALVVASVLLSVALGCESSIDPFVDSEVYYSVFGVLDAEADTQFVRITPLRGSLEPIRGPVDGVVTLERLTTGETVVMRDSVFAYEGGVVAHNFWTAERLVRGETYRLTIRRSDGATTTAETKLPSAQPTVLLEIPFDFFTDPRTFLQAVRILDAQRAADLRITYRLRVEGFVDPVNLIASYRESVVALDFGLLQSFNAYNDIRDKIGIPGACPDVLSAEVFAAIAGPDWPDVDQFDDETLARPDIVTNVTNGVGFIAGVASATIDWRDIVEFLALRRDLCIADRG